MSRITIHIIINFSSDFSLNKFSYGCYQANQLNFIVIFILENRWSIYWYYIICDFSIFKFFFTDILLNGSILHSAFVLKYFLNYLIFNSQPVLCKFSNNCLQNSDVLKLNVFYDRKDTAFQYFEIQNPQYHVGHMFY